jgi:ribose transport system substrate-binding protein
MSTIQRACDILAAFHDEHECLRLADVVQRTGMNKTTSYRALAGLVKGKLIVRIDNSRYKLAIRPLSRSQFRLGYGIQSMEFGFCASVSDSIARSARASGIDLLMLDNRDTPDEALTNAEVFIRESVDLVIESQTDVRTAHKLAKLFQDASIPVIALEIPQPNAYYFGANNIQAGMIAGRYLARQALAKWNGNFDELVLLELPKAGYLPNARILGSCLGLLEQIVWLDEGRIKVLNTDGHFDKAYSLMRKFLRRSHSKRLLVSAINDPSALGALQAFREAGREDQAFIVGHNASSEAHTELARHDSALIGSVGYFPEHYGEGIIALALDILEKRPTRRATFVRHEMVTSSNLCAYYPSNTAS